MRKEATVPVTARTMARLSAKKSKPSLSTLLRGVLQEPGKLSIVDEEFVIGVEVAVLNHGGRDGFDFAAMTLEGFHSLALGEVCEVLGKGGNFDKAQYMPTPHEGREL